MALVAHPVAERGLDRPQQDRRILRAGWDAVRFERLATDGQSPIERASRDMETGLVTLKLRGMRTTLAIELDSMWAGDVIDAIAAHQREVAKNRIFADNRHDHFKGFRA